MNMEGIAALVAAGAAVVGVSASVLVGRWQLRAALRGAEETARTGIAQAEASYRAALDAVRATATETHAQWLRSVRREAYPTFLLACSDVIDGSLRLSLETQQHEVLPDQRQARRSELQAVMSRLQDRALVVSLEGPEELGDQAQELVNTIDHIYRESLNLCALLEATHDLFLASQEPEPDPSVVAYQRALEHLIAVKSAPVVPRDRSELPADVADALDAAMRAREALSWTRYRIGLDALYYARGGDFTIQETRSQRLTQHMQQRAAFVSAARTVLRTVA
ncbi:hypothetical protein [Streptomyces sp. NPDC056405]|uniref:hypothetical protein n=1 Tax=Streptomyces sp. NPDC056405 TaxID=3345811 RepID=UPI0035E32E88